MDKRDKVIIGMSGGVDSAVAAYLLREMGYEVIGVTLRTWEGETSRCCEIDKARETAYQLGIRYYPWNVSSLFKDYVITPFIADYIKGRTPNPCVECNPYVKWAGLNHVADVLKADYIATGHYAAIVRMESERFAVRVAKDVGKDQSYMLYKLTQEDLSRSLFPLGDLTKDEVRELASQIDLNVKGQAESQEICFVPDGNYANYIERESSEKIPIEGNFVDEAGKILGKHKGIIHYTVGQRKGLNLALGYPAYVKRIDANTNEIVISPDESLYANEIFCDGLSFMGIDDLSEEKDAFVKIRYHHKGEWAKIKRIKEDKAQIVFKNPVRAPAPGQSAVFYDERQRVLGGGKIL